MPNQLINVILKTIILIPGIFALAPIDFAKGNAPLKEEDWYKSLSIEEQDDSSFELSIAIVVWKGISARIVAMELNSSVNNLLKNKGIALKRLNIYVRGIK